MGIWVGEIVQYMSSCIICYHSVGIIIIILPTDKKVSHGILFVVCTYVVP